MTRETFEKAQELVGIINRHKQTIKVLDTMLTEYYEPDRKITVSYESRGSNAVMTIRHTDLPELRDALMKARDRCKFDLRKLEDELAAL